MACDYLYLWLWGRGGVGTYHDVLMDFEKNSLISTLTIVWECLCWLHRESTSPKRKEKMWVRLMTNNLSQTMQKWEFCGVGMSVLVITKKCSWG